MTIKAEQILKRLKNTNPGNLTQIMLASELDKPNGKHQRSRLNSNSIFEGTIYNNTQTDQMSQKSVQRQRDHGRNSSIENFPLSYKTEDICKEESLPLMPNLDS